MTGDQYDLRLDDAILSRNVTEKFKLNCLKLWALLIAIAIWHNRMKQTQHNLTDCPF